MTIEAHFTRRLEDFTLDAQLQLPASGVTALFGPSGSGKTTILRAIAGLDRIRGGRLTVNGETWQGRLRFVPPHRRAVGCVFQEPSLFPHLDVRGNLEYGARRAGREQLARRVGEAAAMLDLQPLLSRRPATLSGGEQRRVAIARALARAPRLLLLDEPLTGLDRDRKQEILRCLERLHRELEIPVVLVSHDAEEVARLADHLVLLERGRVRSSGPLAGQLTALDQPLAHADAAAAVIEARVARQEPRWHLTELQFAGGRLTVPETRLPEGASARVRIGARDVSLALRAPVDTSILNVLEARVTELCPDGPGQVLVRLDCGGQPLLARITARSADRLGLAPGSEVYAQVKSLALLS